MPTEEITDLDVKRKLEARKARAMELNAQDFDTLSLDEKLWLINARLHDQGILLMQMMQVFQQLGSMAEMMGGKPADFASKALQGIIPGT